MAGRISYLGGIVPDSLVLVLDAAKRDSYAGTGTVWNNISSNTSNCALVNGPAFNSENVGNIVFDGVNDYADLGNTINFSNYVNGFTIGFWVKILNTSQKNKYLFSKTTNSGDDNQFSVRYGYVTNTFELYAGVPGVGASQDIRTNSQISVNDTSWHFLCYSVGITTVGYLDSQAQFTNSYTDLTFISSTRNNLLASFDGSLAFCNLSLGYVVLYNRILSSSEILQNFNATKDRF